MMWESLALSVLAASLLRPLVLAGCAALAIRLFRIRHPASQHAIWVFVLAAVAILPFFTLLAPRFELPALPAEVSSAPAAGKAISVQSIPPAPPAVTLHIPPSSIPIPNKREDSIVVQAPPMVRYTRTHLTMRQVLLGIYGIGFAAVLSYFALGWTLLQRLLRNAVPARGSRILESNYVSVPVVVGVFRPVVILPRDWRGWSREVRRAVFAHEFAHVRRGDMWVSAFARCVRCVFWFQPLTWWISGRISQLAEMSCDAAALDTVGDPEKYARLLLEFVDPARARMHRTAVPGLAMVGRSGLVRRIDALLALSNVKPRRTAGKSLLLLMVIGISLMFVASTVRLTHAAVKPLRQVQHAIESSAKLMAAAPAVEALSSSIAALAPAMKTIFPEPEPQQTAADARAFLEKYCFGCHSQKRLAFGGGRPVPTLDDQDLSQVAQDREVWEKVVRKLRAGIEPNVPAGPGRPDPAAVRGVVRWFETELDRGAAPVLRVAGRHPLNRTEYRNVVRDLLGRDIDIALILPPDDAVQGFDNIDDALNSDRDAKDSAYKAAAARISLLGLSAPSRGVVLLCSPAAAAEEAACVQRIIRALATRAFRQPVSDQDIAALTAVYRSARGAAIDFYDNYFERGIQTVLQNILADPRFLNRIEVEPANVAAGQTYRISDYELASRLSFFLWSRGPDEELVGLAARGQLHDPTVLEEQVHRMLQDPRSEALAVNFAGQWLSLWNLPVTGPFLTHPDFDEPLRQAMRRETELFFDSIVREDRNVVDLLDANYTFVNERLARHYGIRNVSGDQFRRVTLDPAFDSRRGILGKAAFLTVTSRPDRTSITTRGKWVLSNLLGVFAPDPPPNVLPLPRIDPAATNGPTFRQMMETSLSVRGDCKTCHQIMDPIGIALEPFDVIGMSRMQDAGLPIDASTELLDGTRLNGPADLRNALLSRSGQFVQTLTLKLLTYGLGRRTTYRDMPLVRSIVRDGASENDRFSAIVIAIVKSPSFQMNIK